MHPVLLAGKFPDRVSTNHRLALWPYPFIPTPGIKVTITAKGAAVSALIGIPEHLEKILLNIRL
jgi:hypothetical protein